MIFSMLFKNWNEKGRLNERNERKNDEEYNKLTFISIKETFWDEKKPKWKREKSEWNESGKWKATREMVNKHICFVCCVYTRTKCAHFPFHCIEFNTFAVMRVLCTAYFDAPNGFISCGSLDHRFRFPKCFHSKCRLILMLDAPSAYVLVGSWLTVPAFCIKNKVNVNLRIELLNEIEWMNESVSNDED